MGVINVGEHGLGIQIRKKITASSAYGARKYGAFHYGAGAKFHGIYQVRTRFGKQVVVKEKHYVPTNPQTEPQQAWRGTFAAAVTSWQGLTPEQKDVYNEKARYKNYSGYNLYLREYLLSH